MRLRKVIYSLFLTAGIILPAFCACAKPEVPEVVAGLIVKTPHAAAYLQIESSSPSERQGVLIIDIAPGWHIYGQPPGDVGLPPEIKLRATGAAIGPIVWPAAHDWRQSGVIAHVYEGVTRFPFSLTTQKDAASVIIDGHVDWLVCRDICVPESVAVHVSDAPSGAPVPHEPSETTASPSPADAAGVDAPAQVGFMLTCAFLGGLILNLMPCVFPVLAMKAIGLARMGGARDSHVRQHAALYALGTILAFSGLGVCLAVFRLFGADIHWGQQFQQPVFVAAIAWLLFALGLSLSDILPIGAPGFVDRGGWGDRLGSLLGGAMTVIVAAPCTGPFMGAALLAALTGPVWLLLATMTTLGFGMAVPGLALALAPRAASWLPRPGPWMGELKQLLAFPLYGSALWLVWVLDQQAGQRGLIVGLAGCWCVGLATWAASAARRSRSMMARRTFGGFALIIVAGLSAMGARITSPSTESQIWRPYSPALLAQLRNAGQPVFVDMTASWCLTCLVNERLVLDRPAMLARFKKAHVALLKGDWTNRDKDISQFLGDNGRDGVPLYVFYPAGREPIVLPQILTTDVINRAVMQPRRSETP